MKRPDGVYQPAADSLDTGLSRQIAIEGVARGSCRRQRAPV